MLLEQATFPRYKTCGGGVLHRAFKKLPAGVTAAVERSFHSVALHFQGAGLSFVARRSEPLIYMTMRAELDDRLAREAKKSGAELVEACAVRQLRANTQHVEIAAGNNLYHAKFVIAADGVHSRTAKAMNWPALPRLAPAIEWELFLSEADFQKFGQIARFDFGFVESGYAWVFPKRSHLSAGILSTHPTNVNLRAKLEKYLEFLGINRIERAEKHGHLIPLAPRRGPLARGRVLLVGDAAGLVDPITAEGISYALQSGQLAAEAICKGGFDVMRTGQNYQTLLEENILGDLRAGRLLARLIYDHPRIRSWAFRRHGQQLTDFVAAVVMGERGYHQTLKSPASYLKLLGF